MPLQNFEVWVNDNLYSTAKPPQETPVEEGGKAPALHEQYDFFECPNEDLDWHRAAVEVFRQVVELWSRPPLEVLNDDAAELFRTRFSDLPIP